VLAPTLIAPSVSSGYIIVLSDYQWTPFAYALRMLLLCGDCRNSQGLQGISLLRINLELLLRFLKFDYFYCGYSISCC